MARLSGVARRYVLNFFFRLSVFLVIGGVYVLRREWLDYTEEKWSWPLALLWAAVMASMLSQLNAGSRLTLGCMKQYPDRYEPVPGYDPERLAETVRWQNRGALKTAAVWTAVNLCFGALYYRGVLDVPVLVLLCALAYLCDLVCVLFFCPFQSFLMHNRCCVNCRIFAWGSWMMAAPLMCVPHWYGWTLFGTGLVVLCVWELRFRRYPERFWDGSNRNLQCKTCQERLCRYKRALEGWFCRCRG